MDTLDGRIALITGGSPGIVAAAFRPVTKTSRA